MTKTEPRRGKRLFATTVALSLEDIDRLDGIATSRGMKRSALLREMVRAKISEDYQLPELCVCGHEATLHGNHGCECQDDGPCRCWKYRTGGE